jgi:hypothetical protein
MEHQNAMITRFGISSQSLPKEYIAEKFSNTCLYESEDMLIDHNIDVLKDNTCLPSSMESDMPRSNRGSSESLHIRYDGARSAAVPYHPDLYLGNNTPDERGCQTDPNMRGYKDGMEYRINKYTDLLSDKISDMSISSGVWEQPSINKAHMHVRNDIKKRVKWFDRSQTTDSRGYNSVQSTTSKAKLILLDEADGANNILSDIPSTVFTPGEIIYGKNRKLSVIGRRDVPTHRFNVAKYGNAPKTIKYKYDFKSKILSAEPTAEFKKSEERTLSKLAMIMSREASESEYTAAFDNSSERIGGRLVGNHGDVRESFNKSVNTQKIIDKLMIEQEIKKQKKQDVRDFKRQRNNIYYDQDIYDDAEVNKHISIKRSNNPFDTSKHGRYSLTELDTEKSMVTATYSASPMPSAYKIAGAKHDTITEYENEDSVTVFRGSNGAPNPLVSNGVEQMKSIDETKFDESPTTARHIGPMGKKSKLKDNNLYELQDTLGEIRGKH